MKKEKLLRILKERKVKLECRKRRFEVWQEQLENREISETNIRKTNMYWIKQRRLQDRIEEIDKKISSIETEKSKFSFQIFMHRRAMNENV